MTTPAPIVNYDTGGRGTKCAICMQRPPKKKTYGYDVCSKCHYAFANRRQVAYLIDAIVLTAINFSVNVALFYAARPLLAGVRVPLAEYPPFVMINYAVQLTLASLFICKDGFGGYSLGKLAMGVRVLDNSTGKPAGFLQSWKRHPFLYLSLFPYPYGAIAVVVIILVIAYQDAGGYRLFDKFAGTRVIWKKYAHLPIFGGNALVCESCRYDLQGNTSGTCPECGTAVSDRNHELLAAAQRETPPAPIPS
jgi:uncharacterized RDD family membrane protein YckC